MKTQLTYKRLNPTTVSGDCLEVKIIYSSFDTAEIDKMEEYYKQNVGYALITDDKKINALRGDEYATID